MSSNFQNLIGEGSGEFKELKPKVGDGLIRRRFELELRPVFRTVCLLTLRGHFPSHIFESLFWRFVADA